MVWNTRPKKTNPEDNIAYTYYDPHSEHQELCQWPGDDLVIISIDPGKVNLGFRVERRSRRGPVDQVEVLFTDCYNFKKHRKVKEDEKHNKAEKKGKDKQETEDDSKLHRGLIPEANYSCEDQGIIEYLDSHAHYHEQVHLVLIEKQMGFNTDMDRLFQKIRIYYQLRLRNLPLFPLIIGVNAKLKSKALCDETITSVKDWAVEKALQLSFIRKDWVSFRKIIDNPQNKRDDLSDVIVQIEALCKTLEFGQTKVPEPWEAKFKENAWKIGLVFFDALCQLMRISAPTQPKASMTIWMKDTIKPHMERIILCRDKHELDLETGRWIFADQKRPVRPVRLVFPGGWSPLKSTKSKKDAVKSRRKLGNSVDSLVSRPRSTNRKPTSTSSTSRSSRKANGHTSSSTIDQLTKTSNGHVQSSAMNGKIIHKPLKAPILGHRARKGERKQENKDKSTNGRPTENDADQLTKNLSSLEQESIGFDEEESVMSDE